MTSGGAGAHTVLLTSTPQHSFSKYNGLYNTTPANNQASLYCNGGVGPGQSVKLHCVEPGRSCDLTQ